MKKIIASQRRASLSEFPQNQTVITQKLNAAAKIAIQNPNLDIATSLALIKKLDNFAKDRADVATPRIVARRKNFAELEKAVRDGVIKLKGFVGWGEECVSGVGALKINPGENISREHAVVFEKNGKTYVETLGSAITIFNSPPIAEMVKSSEIWAYERKDDKHPPVATTGNGRVHTVKENKTYDSGAYTLGDRYVVEAPLAPPKTPASLPKVMVATVSLQSTKPEAITLRDKINALSDPAIRHIRSEIFMDTTNKWILHVNAVCHDTTQNFQEILAKTTPKPIEVQQPDTAVRLSTTMCNVACVPEFQEAYKERQLVNPKPGSVCHATYFVDEMNSSNSTNTSSLDDHKETIVYTRGLSLHDLEDIKNAWKDGMDGRANATLRGYKQAA